MRMELGYPDAAAERGMLQSMGRSPQAMRLRQCLNPQQLAAIREQVDAVHVSESLLDYLQRIVARTRQGGEFAIGLSPRGVSALLRRYLGEISVTRSLSLLLGCAVLTLAVVSLLLWRRSGRALYRALARLVYAPRDDATQTRRTRRQLRRRVRRLQFMR